MYIPLVVDNAYTCDPRIKKFKEDEKERKLAEKKAKEDAARAAAEEKERVSIDTPYYLSVQLLFVCSL